MDNYTEVWTAVWNVVAGTEYGQLYGGVDRCMECGRCTEYGQTAIRR